MERGRGREFKSERGREFSVFVHNLPWKLDHYGLKGIFQRAGRVCDTYIPARKGRLGPGKYGFVRFRKVEEAVRSIQLFHGATIRGHRLLVARARPKQGIKKVSPWQKGDQWVAKQGPPIRKMEWKKKGDVPPNNGALIRFSQEEQPYKMSLTGQVNETNEDWLRRSLVCTSEEPRDLATLSSALMYGFDQCLKLSALSSLKFLLTFPTEERMVEALSHPEELHQWFTDVKKWGAEEYCDSRKVWIVILGVPPHGWCWENFKQIAELWGKLICLRKAASLTDSFESMRVLSATKNFQRIDSEILFTLGSCGYRITITEAEMITQPSAKCSQFSNIADTSAQDGIPGFEDVEGSDDDGFFNENQAHEREKVSNSQTNSNSNSNSNLKDVESPRSNDSWQHTTSNTRTKTVSFSHNGYSEEIFKVSQHLKVLGKGDSHDEQSQASQPPPGFENLENEHIHRASKHTLKDSTIGTTTYKEALLHVPSSPDSSASTPESLIKLAHDSLQIGELLGVKVIGNLEAAISRITEPLKKNRSK